MTHPHHPASPPESQSGSEPDHTSPKADDRTQIVALIQRWATAVHTADLTGVLADHAEDIVMFDVPPPYEGVRGLAAYRDTWPPFFQWQASGAVFEITSLEVTAGREVAFAHALVRCGTPADLTAHPEQRLRLTIGLRKESGRWVVTHEHHSFPHSADDASSARARQEPAEAEREIRFIHHLWYDRTAAKDLDGVMSHIADDVVSYEHDTPLQQLGIEQVRRACERGLKTPGGSGGRCRSWRCWSGTTSPSPGDSTGCGPNAPMEVSRRAGLGARGCSGRSVGSGRWSTSTSHTRTTRRPARRGRT